LYLLAGCGLQAFVGPIEGEIAREVGVVIDLRDAYLTALEEVAVKTLCSSYAPIRFLAIPAQQPLLGDGGVFGVAIEGIKERRGKAVASRRGLFQSCEVRLGPIVFHNQVVQTVSLCCRHEIGSFVPLSTDPLMVSGDESQQGK